MPSRRDRPGWSRSAASGPQALPLFAAASEATTAMQAPLVPEPVVTLPAQSEGETVVEDYRATALTLRRHPLALIRPALDRLGHADTRRLDSLRPRAWIRLPGRVLMR